MIIHFPAASNDRWVHVRIKSAVCLCVCMSKSLVDPVVFPVLSRQQADEVAGSSERNTLQHVCACLCMCVCVFLQVCGHMRRTRVLSIAPKAMKVPRFDAGLHLSLSFFFFAKMATATQMKDRYGNQHQQQQQQQEQQQHACGHRKHCKLQAGCGREYILNPHFQVVFFVFWSIRWASLSSVLTVRGKQGKMPPGPFRELCGKVGAEIGAWREGR